MECWKCGKPARGICVFCGRAICKEDAQRMPHPLAAFVGQGQIPKLIVVADALFCGECRPQPEPIEMPEIY